MTIGELESVATKIRRHIIAMLAAAGSGHTGGSLGVVEILVSLYFAALEHHPKDPKWPNRDRLLLSCGHIAPALYATLAEAGYFSKTKLNTLRKFKSPLQGHPHLFDLPGIEMSSGSLGQGLSVGIGMALAGRLNHTPYQVFCLMSDGEQDEGQVWEAAMFASKARLHNLTAIIDRNHIQIDGYTEDILPLEPLKEKYEAFNWHVITVDGHNIGKLIEAFQMARAAYRRPSVIIAETIPGKGVDFMERDYTWHGKAPTATEAKKALSQLK